MNRKILLAIAILLFIYFLFIISTVSHNSIPGGYDFYEINPVGEWQCNTPYIRFGKLGRGTTTNPNVERPCWGTQVVEKSEKSRSGKIYEVYCRGIEVGENRCVT
ncbi:MAG: hypothetical protein ABH950_06100 [Candidatus Altiarchaeota archaeon]